MLTTDSSNTLYLCYINVFMLSSLLCKKLCNIIILLLLIFSGFKQNEGLVLNIMFFIFILIILFIVLRTITSYMNNKLSTYSIVYVIKNTINYNNLLWNKNVKLYLIRLKNNPSKLLLSTYITELNRCTINDKNNTNKQHINELLWLFNSLLKVCIITQQPLNEQNHSLNHIEDSWLCNYVLQ